MPPGPYVTPRMHGEKKVTAETAAETRQRRDPKTGTGGRGALKKGRARPPSRTVPGNSLTIQVPFYSATPLPSPVSRPCRVSGRRGTHTQRSRTEWRGMYMGKVSLCSPPSCLIISSYAVELSQVPTYCFTNRQGDVHRPVKNPDGVSGHVCFFLLCCFLFFPADRSCHDPVKGRAALLVPRPSTRGTVRLYMDTFMEPAAA